MTISEPMLAYRARREYHTDDAIGDRRLSDQLVYIVRDRITPPQQRALCSLDAAGRLTPIDRRMQRALQDLRRWRFEQHIIAELVLPASGNRYWHLTALGRVVRECLEQDPQ